MGRGSLPWLHQQLLLRFDTIRTSDSSRSISIKHLSKLDGCLARFKDWSDGVGVAHGALDMVESSESGFRESIVKSFEAIYIKLRVVSSLLKERREIGRDRNDETRHIFERISNDLDALERQLPDIKSFLASSLLIRHDSVPEPPQTPPPAQDRNADGSLPHLSNTPSTCSPTTEEEIHSKPRVSGDPKLWRAQTVYASPRTLASASLSPGIPSEWGEDDDDDDDYEEEAGWDRELVIRALSESERHASFTAPSDGVRPKMAFSRSSGSPSAAGSPQPVNLTWIEDASSTFKEESSVEMTKEKAGERKNQKKASADQPSASEWERDNEQFRKFIASKLRAMEKHNKNLARKVEELQSRGLSEEERKVVIEEFVKTRGKEEMWEKSVRETAIEEYKHQVLLDHEREQERRNMLMHEARLIEDRAQQEMNSIYQQTGLQIREAEQRHQDEVHQIHQRLTSELLVIERRIHEQIESSMWTTPQKPPDAAEKERSPQISFKTRGHAPNARAEEPGRSQQAPSQSVSGASGAQSRPSDPSPLASETAMSIPFALDQSITHPTERQPSADYGPSPAVAPWESKPKSEPETPKAPSKRQSTTASRFRRLAKALRLRSVSQKDINVVKMQKRGDNSPDSADRKRTGSKGSFLPHRHQTSSSTHHQHHRHRSPPTRSPRPPAAEQAAAGLNLQLPDPSPPVGGAHQALHSPFSFPEPHQPPPPPRHPPFSFQVNFPESRPAPTSSSAWAAPPPRVVTAAQPSQHHPHHHHHHHQRPPVPAPAPVTPTTTTTTTKPTTKVHRNQISPDTLTYYGLPWEWDRVSSNHHHHHHPSTSSSSPSPTPTTPTSKKQKHSHENPMLLLPIKTRKTAGGDKYWPLLTTLAPMLVGAAVDRPALRRHPKGDGAVGDELAV